MQLDLTKMCCRCREVKFRSEFYRNKGRPDGLQTICKDCTKAQNAKWSAENPEKRQFYSLNRELTPEQRERERVRVKRWVEENRERHLETKRRWDDANREKVRDSGRRAASTRHARKLNAFVEAVDPLVVLELADGECGICGGDVDPLDFHVDHIIPLARGGEHSYANTQPAHRSCNQRKWAHIDADVPERLAA